MKYTVFTDGSFSLREKLGGWGFYIKWTTSKGVDLDFKDWGGVRGVTSSAHIELIALYHALCHLETGNEITIYCDNESVVKTLVGGNRGVLFNEGGRTITTGYMRNWKNGIKPDRKEVKNWDLWKLTMVQLDRLTSESKVEILWIKGHGKDNENDATAGNNEADLLSKMGRKMITVKKTA